MDISREILVGMIVLSAFVLVVSGASLYTQMRISTGNACGCLIPIPLFIPFLASVGLFIGMLVYNLFTSREEPMEADTRKLLSFLDNDERKLLEKIIEKGGEVLQSGLVKSTELSKVKVHRILEKFKNKGLIEKKPYGKTNRIVLDEDLGDILL